MAVVRGTLSTKKKKVKNIYEVTYLDFPDNTTENEYVEADFYEIENDGDIVNFYTALEDDEKILKCSIKQWKKVRLLDLEKIKEMQKVLIESLKENEEPIT